jgi:Ca-activated chloride channel family protein
VESEDRLDAVMERVHRCIGEPALTGLRLRADGLQLDGDSQVPGRLPDLFAGAPLTIMGRYRGAAAGSISLEGRDAAGRPWSETAAVHASSNPALTATWARGFLRMLEDRYAIETGKRDTLEKQIVETSLRFGVLSRFTAFVAVDRSAVVNPGGKPQQIVQPVEAPAGWDMRDVMCCAPSPLPAKARSSRALRSKLSGLRCASAPASQPLPSAGAPGKIAGGFLSKLSSVIHSLTEGGAAEEQEPLPAIELGAYRQRARELLEHLAAHQSDENAGRVLQLGMVAKKLDELVEDLRSIGAAADELTPLESLLAALRTFLEAANPGAAEVDGLWAQTKAGLEAFAGPAARTAFWK